MSEETNIYTYERRTSINKSEKDYVDKKVGELRFLWREELKQVLNIKLVFLAIIGFFLGRGVILGELLPFGAAFLAAYSSNRKRGSLLIIVSIILGLATTTKGFNFVSSATNLAILLVFLVFLNLEKKQKWFAVPLLVFSLTVIVKTSFVALLDPSFYNYVVVLFEGALSAVLSVVFIVAIQPVEDGKTSFFKTNEELVCFLVLIASFIVGLGNLEIGLFSIKNILSRFIIMVGCLLGGASLGAVSGTMVGLIPSLGSLVAPTVIGLYAFAGMIGGLFRRFGKLGVGLGFVLGNVLLSIYFTNTSNLMASLGETLIAVLLFLIFPSRWIKEIKKGFKELLVQTQEEDKQVENTTTDKLKQLAKVFGELSKTFQQISCETEVREDKSLKVFIEGVTTKLCAKCPRERYCWDQGELYKTYKGFLEAFNMLEQEGYVKPAGIEDDLLKRCNRTSELLMALNSTYETYRVNKYWQNKVIESRDIVSEQLKGVSVIMDNLAEEINMNPKSAEALPVARPLFRVSFGAAKVGKGGSIVSGDNYSTMDLRDNRWAVVISDGMGVGPKAAMESKAAISLLKQLLKSGINKDVAIKTVNSVLLLRSAEDSFATLDLAIIDLNSAETDLLKIGAAPSFIKRDNSVSPIKSASLPVGILNYIQMETIKKTLLSGDILVMVTDGVLDSRQEALDRDEWLVDFLENLLIDEPQDIADLILWHAKNNSGGRILDDMTVVVAKLEVTDAI